MQIERIYALLEEVMAAIVKLDARVNAVFDALNALNSGG